MYSFKLVETLPEALHFFLPFKYTKCEPKSGKLVVFYVVLISLFILFYFTLLYSDIRFA